MQRAAGYIYTRYVDMVYLHIFGEKIREKSAWRDRRVFFLLSWKDEVRQLKSEEDCHQQQHDHE